MQEWRVDRAGTNSIDPNTILREFDRPTFGQMDNAGLGHTVNQGAGPAEDAGNRGGGNY